MGSSFSLTLTLEYFVTELSQHQSTRSGEFQLQHQW
jgi:hypothetical protein